MKKNVLLLLCLLLIIFLTGCINNYEVPIGNVPTEMFTIAEFVDDNAIYQATSTLIISGKSQPGVIIVARLFDNKNSVYSLSYSDTDTSGNWSIKLDTPDASFKEYSLKISDSTDKYHEYFNNIRFGESWLIVGDDISNQIVEFDYPVSAYTQDKDEVDTLNYNNMFYYEGKWIPASEKISEFGYQLIKKISDSFKTWSKYPISIVYATANNANIYGWLSRDLIDSRKIIKDALVDKNYYVTNDEKLDASDMSYYYENKIKTILGMSFSNIVVNQGIKDLSDANNGIFYQNNEFDKLYFQMLYNFIGELDDDFLVEEKIMLIQAHADVKSNLQKLRLIQTNVSNIYNDCEIIPTYDLTLVYDVNESKYISKKDNPVSLENLEIHDFDIQKLVTRIYNVSNDIIKIPSITNCVQIYNDDKEVVQIRLIFNNVIEFIKHPSIIGLEFYDFEGNLLDDVEYSFSNNELIINLEKKVLVPNDIYDVELEEKTSFTEEVILIEIGKICYAYSSFNYFCNLETSETVIDPFEVLLNKGD